jgi:hypothetical protein
MQRRQVLSAKNQQRQKQQNHRRIPPSSKPHQQTAQAAAINVTKVDKPPPAVKAVSITPEKPEATNVTSSGNQTLERFARHPGVVIAVKIHGEVFVPEIKQSFCLLHAVYNNRVLYDVLLFATIKLPEKDVADIQAILHPAKLIVQ